MKCIAVLLPGILLASTLVGGGEPPAARRPNVLLIVSDDLNCQLGCYGNAVVKTPHIDRLASLGVRFERSYCNYPVCNASRTSFLSGRYPETTRVFGNGTQPRVALGKEYQFLPEYFHAHGYFTAGIGKIAHGSFPESIHWDVFAEPMRGVEEDDAPTTTRRRVAKKANTAAGDVSVPFGWGATSNKDEEEPDGVTARKVARLMEEHAGGPFFIAAGFHKPHVPHTAPKKYFEMYPLSDMQLAGGPTDHAKNIPAIAQPPKYFPELTDVQQRAIIQHYHAATTFMDAQVGVLLETMDRLKLWDNTIVLFLGDHGWHLGEHDGFWAKMSVMEESARAPLIVVAPGKKSGISSGRLVEFVDVFPTLSDLCGLPPQPGVEGVSLAALLDDPQRPWKQAAFSVVTRGAGKSQLGQSVRSERFTYIAWPNGSEQLYDYLNDPREYVNLVADASHASTLAEMRQMMKAGWQSARPTSVK